MEVRIIVLWPRWKMNRRKWNADVRQLHAPDAIAGMRMVGGPPSVFVGRIDALEKLDQRSRGQRDR